jgi:hypothetical protein
MPGWGYTESNGKRCCLTVLVIKYPSIINLITNYNVLMLVLTIYKMCDVCLKLVKSRCQEPVGIFILL